MCQHMFSCAPFRISRLSVIVVIWKEDRSAPRVVARLVAALRAAYQFHLSGVYRLPDWRATSYPWIANFGARPLAGVRRGSGRSTGYNTVFDTVENDVNELNVKPGRRKYRVLCRAAD